MNHHHRSPIHRQLKARQGGFFSSLFDPGSPSSSSEAAQTTPATQATTSSDDPFTRTFVDNPITTSSSQQPVFTPITTSTRQRPTTTSTIQQQPSTTSTSTQQSSRTPSTTSTTPTSTSTTLSSSTSSSSIKSSSSTGPVVITAAPVTYTNTADQASSTYVAYSSVSATPSTTAVPTGGLSTGAIVGSVAGAILGIAAICFLIAFFLRRWRRNRIIEEDFNQENLARAPDMAETGTSNPFEPPQPAFRGHSIAPSFSSGPNMAGQGAYAYNTDVNYADAAYAAGAGAYGAQDSQEHVHQPYYDNPTDDAINGAYSAEPKPQAAYNAEAYGSYVYSTDGSHAVTAPSQQYHPYSSQEYQSHYQDNAVPAARSTPALVNGAPAVAADRARAPSMYDDEDAYAGI
ncbi:hypothetical protein H0H92_008060 [Tricholoma furcatifolium]|nr:hypothetical protein H0H92_008060 [Tricholoma furcatifolium]